MFAVKNSADDGRYASVTRDLSGVRLVRCGVCNDIYAVYGKTAELANSGCEFLAEYLRRVCPHHAEFISAPDEALTSSTTKKAS